MRATHSNSVPILFSRTCIPDVSARWLHRYGTLCGRHVRKHEKPSDSEVLCCRAVVAADRVRCVRPYHRNLAHRNTTDSWPVRNIPSLHPIQKRLPGQDKQPKLLIRQDNHEFVLPHRLHIREPGRASSCLCHRQQVACLRECRNWYLIAVTLVVVSLQSCLNILYSSVFLFFAKDRHFYV